MFSDYLFASDYCLAVSGFIPKAHHTAGGENKVSVHVQVDILVAQLVDTDVDKLFNIKIGRHVYYTISFYAMRGQTKQNGVRMPTILAPVSELLRILVEYVGNMSATCCMTHEMSSVSR